MGRSEVDRPPWNSYENKVVLILMLAGGVAALDGQAVFYLMPWVAAELSLNNTQVGLIGTALLLSWAFSGMIVSRLSDRLGRRKPFLILAFVCFALFSGLSALAGSFYALFLARFLIGVTEGPVIPLQQTVMMAESSPHRRGLNMGVVQNLGAQLFGTMLAPILVVALASIYGWRTAFLVAGLPGLAIALLILRFIREPEMLDRLPATQANEAWRTGIRAVWSEHNVRLCVVISVFSIGWSFMLLTFLPLWLTRNLGFSSQTMSLVMAAMGAAGIVSAIVVPGLSDLIGRKRVMAGFAALGAIAPIGAVLLANPIAIAAALFVGSMMVGTFPLFMGTVPLESVSARYSATASAMVIGIGQLAGAVWGGLAGTAADAFGLYVPLLLAAVFALLAALAAMRVREPTVTSP